MDLTFFAELDKTIDIGMALTSRPCLTLMESPYFRLLQKLLKERVEPGPILHVPPLMRWGP